MLTNNIGEMPKIESGPKPLSKITSCWWMVMCN